MARIHCNQCGSILQKQSENAELLFQIKGMVQRSKYDVIKDALIKVSVLYQINTCKIFYVGVNTYKMIRTKFVVVDQVK